MKKQNVRTIGLETLDYTRMKNQSTEKTVQL